MDINCAVAVVLLNIVIVNSQFTSFFDDIDVPRIAIVGGGIGGSTAAYKLKDFFGESLTTLDVYEKDKIGGRLRTININGEEYETGGSVIHPANQHMIEFTKLLGLRKGPDQGDGSFAMFDGSTKVFEPSRNSWVQTGELLWRYGWSLLTMQRSTNNFLNDFSRIYKWQDEYQSFTTLPNLLLSMSDDIMNATQLSLRQLMTSQGVSQKLVDELVLAACRVNYGQTPDNLHALVGSVSVAGAEPGLWDVKGGNYKVAEGLLQRSKANIIPSAVVKIVNSTVERSKPLYSIHSADGSVRQYDAVILAYPFIAGQQSVEFSGFPTDFSELHRQFHHLFVYIVEGTPNYKHFGYDSLNDMPEIIFPLESMPFYNQISRIYPVSGLPSSTPVYKVFSSGKLSPDELDLLFLSRELTQVVEWMAYPEYSDSMEFTPFVLAPNLYHVNAIELAASAMEMSTIGAVNVATLLYHHSLGNSHRVDNMFVIEEKHLKMEL